MEQISLNSIMRRVVTILDMPVKFVLIVMLIITLIFVGELIAEYFQRRVISIKASSVIDAIRAGKSDPATIIKNSGLLVKQKRLLLGITLHEKLSDEMLENYAVSLMENYNQDLDWNLRKTELIAKLGPTFGLLGTLIPLGPGIIALSQGDTATLSYSLLAAFDTTVIGLISGSICTVISMIRRRWYDKDRIMLTVILEAVLEKEKENKEKGIKTKVSARTLNNLK